MAVAMTSGGMGAPVVGWGLQQWAELGSTAGLPPTLEHGVLLPTTPPLPRVPGKYSVLLVPGQGKGQASVVFCRKDRSIRSSDLSEVQVNIEVRGKSKSYWRNCTFLAQYTDGLQCGTF